MDVAQTPSAVGPPADDDPSPDDPRAIAVVAYASVLDRGGYARRVLDAARTWRDAFPRAAVRVLSVESPRALRDARAREEVTEALRAHGVAFDVLHGWPRRWGLARLADRLAAYVLARRLRRSPADLLHAHGPRAVRLSARARRRASRPSSPGRVPALVADVHGDRAAEVRLGAAPEGAPLHDHDAPVDPREAEAVASADGALHASEALARRFPVGPGRASGVVPCAVDGAALVPDEAAEARRVATRRAWGLAGDERVVAYAGSLAPWQEADRMARVLAHAAERVPQLRVLFLTPAREAGKALLARAGLARGRAIVVTPRSSEVSEVVAMLCGADAALLLRRPALANALAFPTKLLEYLAAGLEVVASDACPAVVETLARGAAPGVVLPWEADDATYAARLSGASRPASPAERAARRAVARALARGSFVPRCRAVARAALSSCGPPLTPPLGGVRGGAEDPAP